MGVRGLTTFVENNQQKLYDKENLHDCSLVIDGFGLVYHLYFGRNLDYRHGGEFAAFAEVIDRFFEQLRSCNIKPYVVFDGPIEPDKLPCVLSRLHDRVSDVHNTLENETNHRARVLPLFAVDVMFCYLASHHIEHAVSLVEADSEIVAVANTLECPVLSEDSDYYIYDIKHGYVPFPHLYWEKICVDKGVGGPSVKSMICHKYKISNMVREYGVSESLLPYLSVLLGNDWLPKDTFKHFMTKLPQPKSSQKQKKQRRHDHKISSLLWWLTTKSNENSILDKIRYSLRNRKRDEIITKVETCLALYRDKPDVSETLRILREYWMWEKSTVHDGRPPDHSNDQGPEDEIRYLVRTSNVHPVVINLLDSKYACLPVNMHDSRKPSPHVCAAEIRTLFYRVLLRKYHFKTAGPEFLFFQEYDKIDHMYKKSRTVSIFTSLCPMCEQHHTLEETCKSTQSYNVTHEKCSMCVKLVLRLLQLDSGKSYLSYTENSDDYKLFGKDFMTNLDIVMVSTLFWYKKTLPKQVHVCSLLLAIVWSISQYLAKRRKSQSRAEKMQSENMKKNSENSSTTMDTMNGSTGASHVEKCIKRGEKSIVVSQDVSQTGVSASKVKKDMDGNAETAVKPQDLHHTQDDPIKSNPASTAISESTKSVAQNTQMETATPSDSIQCMNIDDNKASPQRNQSLGVYPIATDPPHSSEDFNKSQILVSQTQKESDDSTECCDAGKKPRHNESTFNFVPISVYKFLNLFGSLKLKTASGAAEKLDSEMDVGILHSTSEWLCILNAALLLNDVTEGQRSMCAIQDFLASNILLHDIHSRIERLLKTTTDNVQNDIKLMCSMIADRLDAAPGLKKLFQDFADFLMKE